MAVNKEGNRKEGNRFLPSESAPFSGEGTVQVQGMGAPDRGDRQFGSRGGASGWAASLLNALLVGET